MLEISSVGRLGIPSVGTLGILDKEEEAIVKVSTVSNKKEGINSYNESPR